MAAALSLPLHWLRDLRPVVLARRVQRRPTAKRYACAVVHLVEVGASAPFRSTAKRVGRGSTTITAVAVDAECPDHGQDKAMQSHRLGEAGGAGCCYW